MVDQKSVSRSRHRNRAMAVLFFSIVGLSFASLGVYSEENNAPEFWAIIFAFASVLLPDRVADVIASFSSDVEDEENNSHNQQIVQIVRDHFSTLSSHLLAAHDIIAFPTRSEGLEHCIYLANYACHIRNTALRYGQLSSLGNPNDLDDVDKVYMRWIEEKKKNLSRGHSVTELISKYFQCGDPMRDFAESQTSAHYSYRCLDDVANPMVQVTIFEFDGGRPPEIVMGWEIPGKEEGLAFASRHEDIISYFEAYFSHNFAISKNASWVAPRESPPLGMRADQEAPLDPGGASDSSRASGKRFGNLGAFFGKNKRPGTNA